MTAALQERSATPATGTPGGGTGGIFQTSGPITRHAIGYCHVGERVARNSLSDMLGVPMPVAGSWRTVGWFTVHAETVGGRISLGLEPCDAANVPPNAVAAAGQIGEYATVLFNTAGEQITPPS
jgi:hypothetical protein